MKAKLISCFSFTASFSAHALRQGEIRDLALTFTVVDSSLGMNQEIELIPGGAKFEVTAKNKY